MYKNLKDYTKQTNIQLIIGGLLILFIVGGGLIWYLYGFGAAIMGVLCLIGGLIPIGLVVLSLAGLDEIVKRINKD